jgi:two-component system response regulator NreC
MAQTDLLGSPAVRESLAPPTGAQPIRVVVVGDTCVSEQGMASIVGRDKRYRVCGGAHGFYDAGALIRKYRPYVLLIEPFLQARDGIRWIKDLMMEYPRTRILIVSRQSERIYAERALHAGAAGYWMENGSAEELLRAVETVAAGEIYVSPLITSLAIRKFAHRGNLPKGVSFLSDRELAVLKRNWGMATLKRSGAAPGNYWAQPHVHTRVPDNALAASLCRAAVIGNKTQ